MNYAMWPEPLRFVLEIMLIIWPIAGLGLYLGSKVREDYVHPSTLWERLCWGPVAWLLILMEKL